MLQVNEYFEGKVKSIAFQTATLPATVGVLSKGEYQFSTAELETMTVVSGMMDVKLPDSDTFKSFHAGSVFKVGAGQTFSLKINEETAYLCTYG